MEVFLNTFHLKNFFSINDVVKYHEKTVLKTLQLEFIPAAFITNVKIWNIMYQLEVYY